MAAFVMVLAFLQIALACIFGARRAVFGIVLMRSSCDLVFDHIKEMFGSATGPGASVNILVIVIGIASLFAFPLLFASPTVLAFGSFLGAALASMLHGPDPAQGMRLLLTLATYAGVFIVAKTIVRRPDDIAPALHVAAWSSVGPNAFALVGIVSQSFVYDPEGRLESTFTHPNIYAFYLMAVVTILLFLIASTRSHPSAGARLLMTIYIGLCLALLIMTKTRSAWIALSLILATYAVVIDRRWLVLVIAAPFTLLIPDVAERLSDLGSGNIAVGYEQLNSYAWRQLLWTSTLDWMHGNPNLWLGNGLDLYQSYLPQFFERGAYQSGVGPHNALLQIFFEMGAAGIVSFGAIFLALFVELGRNWRDDWPGTLLMGMLGFGFIIICSSDNVLDYLQFQWLFWFALGVACAPSRERRVLASRRMHFHSMKSSPESAVAAPSAR